MHQQNRSCFSLLIVSIKLIDVCFSLVAKAEVNSFWSLLDWLGNFLRNVFFALSLVYKYSCLLCMWNLNHRPYWLFENWSFDYLSLGGLKTLFVEILYLFVIKLHDVVPEMRKVFENLLAIVYWSFGSPQLSIILFRPWRRIHSSCWRRLFPIRFGV